MSDRMSSGGNHSIGMGAGHIEWASYILYSQSITTISWSKVLKVIQTFECVGICAQGSHSWKPQTASKGSSASVRRKGARIWKDTRENSPSKKIVEINNKRSMWFVKALCLRPAPKEKEWSKDRKWVYIAKICQVTWKMGSPALTAGENLIVCGIPRTAHNQQPRRCTLVWRRGATDGIHR